MKKCILCLLCILILYGICSPAYAQTDAPSLAEIAHGQIPEEIRTHLQNVKNYDDQAYLLIKDDDLSKWLIIADCLDISIAHYAMQPSELAAEQSVSYYLLNPENGRVLRAEILEDNQVSLQRCEDLAWPSVSPHLLEVFQGESSVIRLEGQLRTVTALYSFTKSFYIDDGCLIPPPFVYAYGLIFFDTLDGWYVRLYTGKHSQDMTLAEYREWAEAFCDYADFYNNPMYASYVNYSLDQFGEFVHAYDTVGDYYAYVRPIRQANEEYVEKELTKWFTGAAIATVAVAGVVAFVVWRRAVNRKKYHM